MPATRGADTRASVCSEEAASSFPIITSGVRPVHIVCVIGNGTQSHSGNSPESYSQQHVLFSSSTDCLHANTSSRIKETSPRDAFSRIAAAEELTYAP